MYVYRKKYKKINKKSGIVPPTLKKRTSSRTQADTQAVGRIDKKPFRSLDGTKAELQAEARQILRQQAEAQAETMTEPRQNRQKPMQKP
jgi:hypothetical protein